MNPDALSFVTLSGDAQDPEFYGAVVARVHSHNSAQVADEGRIGIQFLGQAVVRLFGAGAALQHFGNHPQVRRLLGRSQVTPPAAVPAGAPLLRVSRNNALDHAKPAYQARQRTSAVRDNGLKTQVREAAADNTLVHLRSHGNKQSFRLSVKVVPVPADAQRVVRFNNYGLCLEGGVPAF